MKSKKSALLLSFTSLLICFAMLVGSTFAWFTDTATTGVNKIVAGNLKVDLVAADGETSLTDEGGKLLWTQKVEGESDGDEKLVAVDEDGLPLWEPGVTFLTQGFKIANKGNLALKWKMTVNKENAKNGKASDDAKDGKSLLDVIDFSVVTSTAKDAEAVKIEDFVGHLTKETTSDETYYIKGHMQEEAGNDYQNLTLEGITITVYATQDTVEYDSFDDQYDKNANVTLVTPETAVSVFSSQGGDHVRNASGTYVLTPGVYSLSAFNFRGTEPVTLIASEGVKFTKNVVEVTYYSYSHKDTDQDYTKEYKGALTVTGFDAQGIDLRVLGDVPSITVDGNKVNSLYLHTQKSDSLTVTKNVFSGSCKNSGDYNAYIVAEQKDASYSYDLTVTDNTFAGAQNHAIGVQGRGTTYPTANNITVTGNTFNSYGANGKTERAAFKIWNVTGYATEKNAELTEAAKALVESMKVNNTFSDAVKSNANCVLADFFENIVAFN